MNRLELVIFENDPQIMQKYHNHGINHCLIDMEVMGKDLRQLGFDTDINPGTYHDLASIAALPRVTSWCRLNQLGSWSEEECEKAIAAGAQILILPMIRQRREVEEFLELINGRTKICIMLETERAVELAEEVHGLPFEYAYFGLHDYNIATGNRFIFKPLLDGTIEKVRRILKDYKFGFAGLTDIAKGAPIPAIQILKELARLKANFVFLRRSFKKDVCIDHVQQSVSEIDRAWMQNISRTADEIAVDHNILLETLSLAQQNKLLAG